MGICYTRNRQRHAESEQKEHKHPLPWIINTWWREEQVRFSLFASLNTQHRHYQQCSVMIFVMINTRLQTPVSRPKTGRAFNQSKRGEETMGLVSGRKTELIILIYNLFLLGVSSFCL